jgi:hypothetical protein
MLRTSILRALAIVAALVLPSPWTRPAAAGVTVRFDEAAINELLPVLAPREVQVPLPGAGSVAVRLDDLRVVGFEPGESASSPGHIRTTLRAVVPALGLTAPLEPRLSLRVESQGQTKVLRLRFEQIPLRLPMAGSVDLAPFVEPMDFPVDSFHEVEGLPERTEVRSTLSGVKMESHAIRFDFDIDVVSADGGAS